MNTNVQLLLGSPGLPSLNKTLQEPLNTPNATDYFEMTDEDLTWICKQLFEFN